MVIRFPWQKFPPVITHTNRASVEGHPAHASARAGDYRAARQLVRELVKPTTWAGRVDYVCPAVQFDTKGRWNAIPVALAELIAEESGAKLVATVIREKAAADYPSDSVSRIVQQSGFDGKVPKGSYLICHDLCMYGSTLANLRGHIMNQGGDVVGATALAATLFSSNLVPDTTVLMGISARFRNELATITTHLGFDYDRLTSREAYFIYGLKNLECIRNPQAPSHRVAGPRF